jgi:hypothetical protein
MSPTQLQNAPAQLQSAPEMDTGSHARRTGFVILTVLAALCVTAALTWRTLAAERSLLFDRFADEQARQLGEVAKALAEVAGAEVADRIQWRPDPAIQKIVSGWLPAFDARRARDLGFQPDTDIEEIIRAHVEDELGGVIK